MAADRRKENYMLAIIFFAAFIWVFFKLFVLGIKAVWGIARVLCTILLLPTFVLGLFLMEMVSAAIFVLVVVGLGVILYNAIFAIFK